MEHTVAAWLARFGPLGLFFLQAFGIFGLPIPDETIMVLAGAMVRHGQLGAVPTAGAAVAGAIAGMTLSFALGRFGGLPLLTRYGSRVHISGSAIARAEHWFEGIGKWLLAIGYFVPGVRHVSAIVAGASGLPVRTFSIFAYAGAVLWVGCFLTIGYALGDDWRRLLNEFIGNLRLVVLAIGIVVALIIWRRRR